MIAEELKTRFQMMVSSICVYIYIEMACGKPMSQLDFDANLRRVRVSVASDKRTVWPAAMKRFGSLLIASSNDIHQEQTHTHTFPTEPRTIDTKLHRLHTPPNTTISVGFGVFGAPLVTHNETNTERERHDESQEMCAHHRRKTHTKKKYSPHFDVT